MTSQKTKSPKALFSKMRLNSTSICGNELLVDRWDLNHRASGDISRTIPPFCYLTTEKVKKSTNVGAQQISKLLWMSSFLDLPAKPGFHIDLQSWRHKLQTQTLLTPTYAHASQTNTRRSPDADAFTNLSQIFIIMFATSFGTVLATDRN